MNLFKDFKYQNTDLYAGNQKENLELAGTISQYFCTYLYHLGHGLYLHHLCETRPFGSPATVGIVATMKTAQTVVSVTIAGL